MKNRLVEFVLNNPGRLALPLGMYASLELTGQSVKDAVNDPKVQSDAQIAWHQRYGAPFMLIAMDQTVEAEIYGAQVRFEENVIPTITGRLMKSRADLSTLIDPKVGHKRTTVQVSALQFMKENASADMFVLGSMTGPLTLAAQLYGVADTLALVDSDPALLRELLEIATRFLLRYGWGFREVGADGVIMSEPAAGLITPQAVEEFSSPYVSRIVEFVQNEQFALVYHNCRAKLEHLPVILQSGAAVYHFGAPMDLLAALDAVDSNTILSGNLDPVEVFVDGTPQTVTEKTRALLQASAGRVNFIISAGCQLQPKTPLANVDAFYQAVADFNQK